MPKTHLSRLLCLTLALQFVFPAQVFATATPEQQRQEVLNKVHELLSHPAAQGAELRDANRSPLSRDQFVAQTPSEFYMIPSGTLNGAPYAIRVKSTVNADRELVVSIALMDQQLQSTFTRRSLTLRHSQSSAQQLVELERAVNTMVQSLQAATTKGKNNRKVASGVESSETRTMIKRAATLSAVLGVVSAILGFTQTFGPTADAARGRLFTASLAFFFVTYALNYIAGPAERSTWNIPR